MSIVGRVKTLLRGDNVNCLAISRDGRILAVATGEPPSTVRVGTVGQVQVWDLRRGKKLRTFSRDTWVTSVALSPDADKVFGASWSDTVYEWSIKKRGLFKKLIDPRYRINYLALTPDGKHLITIPDGFTMGKLAYRQWDLPNGPPTNGAMTRFYTVEVTAIEVAPNGKWMALAANSNDLYGEIFSSGISIYDVASGKLLRRMSMSKTRVHAVAISPDGGMIAAADDAGLVEVWDAQSGRLRERHSITKDYAFCVAFSGDSKLLAAGFDRRTAVWQVGGNAALSVVHKKRATTAMNFLPGTNILVTGDSDGRVRLWKLRLQP